MTRIFISHSHSDEAIAFKLVNFLLAALKLEEDAILCTSNPDQGLSYSSSSITDQLKHQLKNSEAIIILITVDSLHSAWIPFEVGAFWTTDKSIIPILGPNLTQNDLPGPLKSFPSIVITSGDFADKLNSAINQLTSKLAIEQKITRRRNSTLKEFSQHLQDCKSKYPSKTSEQQQIEELTKQQEELKIAFKEEKEQIKQDYQDEIAKLQKSLLDRQQLEESLNSQIQQLEQQVQQSIQLPLRELFVEEFGGGQGNRFSTRNLQLNGEGNQIVLNEGGQINATMEIKHDCPECGTAINQIIVGIAAEELAQACVWMGERTSNGWQTVSFPLNIPYTSGIYYIRTRYAQAYNREEALSWWRVGRPNGPTEEANIGAVVVN